MVCIAGSTSRSSITRLNNLSRNDRNLWIVFLGRARIAFLGRVQSGRCICVGVIIKGPQILIDKKEGGGGEPPFTQV